jgi:hypothetical protein
MCVGKVVSRPALVAVVWVLTLWPLAVGYAGSQEKVVGVSSRAGSIPSKRGR